MDFEQAIRSELSTISNLNTKIFPLFAPENTSPPFLIYQKTRLDLIKTMDGTTKLRDARYEVDIISKTYDQLQDLIADVKAKLISFEGRVIGTSGPFVQSMTIENVVEIFEDMPEFHRVNFEIRTFFMEV